MWEPEDPSRDEDLTELGEMVDEVFESMFCVRSFKEELLAMWPISVLRRWWKR